MTGDSGWPPPLVAAVAAADPPSPSEALVCRTVGNYDTEDALRAALMSLDLNCKNERDGAPPVDESREEETDINDNWDWVIANLDEKNSIPLTVGDELRRLMALKSYLILDSEREKSFDTLTNMASRSFGVPIALVSLVDLGRQWFMSNHGLGDTRETPRKLAFCAHAIQGKKDIFEVPDTHKDPRFQDHGLVLGPPYIRFYAGAPLISPEGYKLGTFCIIDSKPWPEGMTYTQRANLLDFAAITSKIMEDRRQLIHEEDPSRLVAAAAHDLMTPLLGVQSSLAVLEEDTEKAQKLDKDQKHWVKTARQGTALMRRICQTTIESLNDSNKSSLGCSQINWLFQKTKSSPCVNLKELVQTLSQLMDSVPKQVPLTISLDATAPEVIVCDDLKLFRCSLNFLANACRNTKSGFIRFTVSPGENKMLVFECTDTGRDLEFGSEESPFGSCSNPDSARGGEAGLGFFSIASQVEKIGGKVGYRKRGEGKGGTVLLDDQGRRMKGSIFWFSVPIVLPKAPPKNAPRASLVTSTSSKESSRQNDSCAPMKSAASSSSNPISPISVMDGHGAVSAPPTVKGKLKGGFNSDKKPTADQGSSVTKPNVEANAEKKKVLIIEDSVIVAKTLARGLNKLGYEVTEARNGKEGLDAMKKELFDLVLCDFIMPKVNGIECVQCYRKWEQTQVASWRQYIVGISAHAGENDVKKGLDVGMNIFQPKPITSKVLKALIQSPKLEQFARELENAKKASSNASTETTYVLQAKGTKRSGKLLSTSTSNEQSANSSDAMNDKYGPNGDKMQKPKAKRPKLTETAVTKQSSRVASSGDKICHLASTDTSAKNLNLSDQLESSRLKPIIVATNER